MKQLKNNPKLKKELLENIFDFESTIIVSPIQKFIAENILNYFLNNIWKFKLKNKQLVSEEVYGKGLITAKVLVEKNLKPFEFIVITKKDVFYSKGIK